MNGLLKIICICVLLVCIALLIYSIVNAIITTKKNKAADEMSAKIFMEKVNREIGQQTERVIKPDPIPISERENKIKEKKSLNYDIYEEDVIPEEVNGKSLKDFYSAN